ncbi:MAG: T9SS type A sorting domain-containing protein [Bacteroidales bacterium]
MTNRYFVRQELFRINFIIVLVFISFGLNGQIIQSRDVFSAGGGKSDVPTYSNFGVLGESFAGPLSKMDPYTSSSGFFNIANIINGIEKSIVNVEEILFYPNPVKSMLYFESQPEKVSGFEIINIAGEILLKSEMKAEINLSELYPGLYFISFLDNNGKCLFSDKLVVIK